MLSNFAHAGGCSETACTFAEAVKYQRRGNNTIWMDIGESHMRRFNGYFEKLLSGRMERMTGGNPVGKGGRIVGQGGMEVERGG